MDAVKNTLFPGAGGTDSTAADGVPWWMKYVAKALAILSAVGQYRDYLSQSPPLQVRDKYW